MRIDEIDDRDRAILRELMRDGRLTNAELAERVHLSQSACLRRVRMLEESGLIAGYVMLLDPVGGRPARRRLRLGDARPAGPRARSTDSSPRRARHPEIIECYLLAGPADYLLRIAFRDARDFERIHTDILTQLPGVSRVQSTMTLRTVKKTTALPL